MPPTTNSGANSDIVRLLGPMERFLWAADFDHPTHFAMSAQIKGQTSMDSLYYLTSLVVWKRGIRPLPIIW